VKWYQPIECDNTVKNPLVCEFDNLAEYGYEQYFFKEGKAIENWPKNIIFQAKKKKNSGNPDDVLQNAIMLPVYSPQLIQELNFAGIGGIQYLPVIVLQHDDTPVNGFCIANLLNFAEAFDYDKSDYDRFPEDFPNRNVRGKLAGVKRFVLKDKALKGFDIIRLKEYTQGLFVSERFKEIFESHKFSGYSFIEVELA